MSGDVGHLKFLEVDPSSLVICLGTSDGFSPFVHAGQGVVAYLQQASPASYAEHCSSLLLLSMIVVVLMPFC